MGIKQLFIVISSVLLLVNCSGGFSKGVKTDLSTGLTTSYNGFAISDIYLVMDGKKCSNNKIPLGKKVIIEATGVGYYAEKNGKVFPGCSIVLLDKNGKELLNLADAFENLKDGLAPKEATLLQADLNTGEPMVAGEKYQLKVRFFDKLKKESEIRSEVTIEAI